MGETKQVIGSISWTDLTVPNADIIRQFYESVVGWKSMPFSMDGYNDYCMSTPDAAGATTVAGICHARGNNADLPPMWLIYITVADLGKSIQTCTAMGGAVLTQPRDLGEQGRFAVIRDPAGAVVALFQPAQIQTK